MRSTSVAMLLAVLLVVGGCGSGSSRSFSSVYSASASVHAMVLAGLLRPGRDLRGGREQPLHRANVVVTCDRCSQSTLSALGRALGDL